MREKLIQSVVRFMPQLVLALFIGSTLATSTVAGMKLVKAASDDKPNDIAKVQAAENKDTEKDPSSEDDNPESLDTVSQDPVPPLVSQTISPTVVPQVYSRGSFQKGDDEDEIEDEKKDYDKSNKNEKKSKSKDKENQEGQESKEDN
ncbi:MAG: hypothetical protein UT63_C0068G0006 [Candidatus Gottesmanbacteria bacterium GW2011_GWC2_39_8]|uniref:Uncharacterized protein n=1 Tax=Candidatus Gottesmanbacteria bacterium GW2011_GWC2_39_8 TaxID=1618450 RepID=A0A0G0Q2A5_9BACT|nr:MAG: hypothetical protein UT63_C0068G0006 [Candidatus Gottesmanbacteria bacterium GW2011_GWC2_39_8]